jgi:ribonucleoside-diphosphate reductase alpha chain
VIGNCVEITQPTKDYRSELDLYLQEDHGRGEVSMCSLAAINVANITSDEEYLAVARSALEMIDEFIDLSNYAYPHIEYTVKQRRNAAVGMIGVATLMARKNLKYDTVEGRNELFLMAERHAYFLTLASLQLGIERGNAPWIHKTKWPEGWTYADSYNKNVDKLVTVKPKYDWKELSRQIIANGGIRNSCLIAHMPTESSSKGSGAPNGVYPIRDINLLKTDDNNAVEWVAKDSDTLKDNYQRAYDTNNIDLIKAYSVIQAWTDGSISADLYVDRSKEIKVNASQLVKEYLTMQKYGLKTRYYYNTKAAKVKEKRRSKETIMEASKERGCVGGGCDV